MKNLEEKSHKEEHCQPFPEPYKISAGGIFLETMNYGFLLLTQNHMGKI